jgi:hypothetical protein
MTTALTMKAAMKNTRPLFKSLGALAAVAVIATGCASVAVKNEAIEARTATALGLTQDQFTISDRVDDGVRADYKVKTKAGKQYACYVTGTISYLGRVVSDPICTEVGKPAKQGISGGAAGNAAGNPSCNALLKAAGKCQ